MGTSARDLIVVLPGVMGSVLARNGTELWSVALGTAARALQRDRFARDLTLTDDDPERATLDDGVVATRLIDDATLIPGFWKVEGYSGLIRHLATELGGTVGDPYTPDPKANIFPFPYDWRRDNRSAARRLKEFVHQQLPVWRQGDGGADAKLILIGHSMGGLIARYYLEVLGGHEHCRALFTFGTPHRGSLNALGYLVNGYKLAWLDMSAALRSFTSVYQLLPLYEVVERGGSFVRPSDLGDLPGFSQVRAQAAVAQFHGPIEASARSRGEAGGGYVNTAFIGTQQPTTQSARLLSGALTMAEYLPGPLAQHNYPEFGDGTVPLYGAMPPGAKADRLQRVYAAESHAALQNNAAMQRHLIASIKLLQAEAALLDAGQFATSVQSGLRLILEDAYPPEGGLIRVQPADLDVEPGPLQVTITALESRRTRRRLIPFRDGEWRIELRRPRAGVYRISAALVGAPPHIQPVRDLFEVAQAPLV